MILLDRDGVLNKLVVDAEHGTIDSPLHESQVQLHGGASEALRLLTDHGYGVAICTNQPAAAKQKTTRENLERVHARIVSEMEASGGRVLSSHICWHRAEDGCACRKPKTGLLEEAFLRNPTFTREGAWMVGDGIGDLKAGRALGLKTAFLGPDKVEYLKVFSEHGVTPDLLCRDLIDFVKRILK